MKIFYAHEFDILYPDVTGLSPSVLDEFRRKLGRGRLEDELNTAKSVAEAERAICAFVHRAEKAILERGHGFFGVKILPGKTDKSVKARIECFAGVENLQSGASRRIITSEFFAPASLVTESVEKGHGYLPAQFVKTKLKEIAERSYKAHKYKRIPVKEVVWPPVLKEKFMRSLLDQLPTQDTIDKETAERAQIAEAGRLALEQSEAEFRLRQERMRPVIDQKKKNADIARKKRIASMETHAGVDAAWHTYETRRGSFVRVNREAKNVTVRISGARAYVIFQDGNEVIVATKNLKFESIVPSPSL